MHFRLRVFAGCLGLASLLGAAPGSAETLYLGSPTALYSFDTVSGTTTAFATPGGTATGWKAPRPVRVSVDGATVCTADNAAVTCYDTNTKALKARVATTISGPYGWDMSQDGRTLVAASIVGDAASGGTTSGVRVVDISTGAVKASLALDTYAVAVGPSGTTVTVMAIDPTDGSNLLQGRLPFNLVKLDLATGATISTTPLRDAAMAKITGPWSLYGLVDTGSGYVLWNADATAAVRLISADGVQQRQVAAPSVNMLTVSADGVTAYMANGSKAYSLNLATAQLAAEYLDNQAASVSVKADGSALYVAGPQGGLPAATIVTWATATNTVAARQAVSDAEVTSVAAVPALRRLPMPTNGWWYATARSGSGYSIEFQGDKGFIGSFTYDAAGKPIWLVTSCTLTLANVCSGTLNQFAGGVTLGGTYQPPTFLGAPYGTMTITFTASDRAKLAWPGHEIDIVRFPIDGAAGISAAPSWAPETGWWWSPTEGGRGFFIESQGAISLSGATYSNLFLAGYMYESDGRSTWYTSQSLYSSIGTLGGAIPYFQGQLTEFAGGPPISGTAIGMSVAGIRGSITIQFPTRTTATLTLPNGRNVSLIRFAIQ